MITLEELTRLFDLFEEFMDVLDDAEEKFLFFSTLHSMVILSGSLGFLDNSDQSIEITL